MPLPWQVMPQMLCECALLTFPRQMESYMDAQPILAVKSEVYFGFQIRRMKELRNVQTYLSKYRPANYGAITAVLMHMIRHIPHSPVAKTGYLRDALRDLRFHEVMERFGTFFLHDLDLDHATLSEIDEEDSDACLLSMSRDKSLQRIKEKRMAEVAIVSIEEPTAQFPIGNAPTWEEIAMTVARNLMLLMSSWTWNERWATRSTAARLFTQFTVDYFLTLNIDILKNGEFPKPKDLKEAMELWTVQSLMTVLKDVSFKATNHGLRGKVGGRRNPSFKDLVDLFFPVPEFNIRKESVWHPFLSKGYIREFHETIGSMTNQESSSLLMALGRIFGRLQCLPNAVACTQKACGRLWEQFEGGIRMLTNPVFYKIETVGKAKRSATVRAKQVKASKAIIEARLDEQHRQIPFDEGRIKARRVRKARNRETKRRTGKRNNYRKPPIRQKRQASPTASPEDSYANEVHVSSDENTPNVPSVRVLRRRVISEEDPEDDGDGDDLDGGGPDEVEEEEEEEELDQLDDEDEEDEDEEHYGNCDSKMDVDEDHMDVDSY